MTNLLLLKSFIKFSVINICIFTAELKKITSQYVQFYITLTFFNLVQIYDFFYNYEWKLRSSQFFTCDKVGQFFTTNWKTTKFFSQMIDGIWDFCFVLIWWNFQFYSMIMHQNLYFILRLLDKILEFIQWLLDKMLKFIQRLLKKIHDSIPWSFDEIYSYFLHLFK